MKKSTLASGKSRRSWHAAGTWCPSRYSTSPGPQPSPPEKDPPCVSAASVVAVAPAAAQASASGRYVTLSSVGNGATQPSDVMPLREHSTLKFTWSAGRLRISSMVIESIVVDARRRPWRRRPSGKVMK